MTESRGRVGVLWAITAIFAIFNIVTAVMPTPLSPGAVGIINTLLLVAFALLHGALQYGGKGIAIFLVVCLVVSNVFENCSILTGFPFGHYYYTDVLGPKLFLVPVAIGGAYFGAGYLSWTVSQVLLGRTKGAIDTFARWTLPVVASFLMTSWDFTLDPSASTVDHYWIWQNGGGFFGVPFQNYMGWLLTVFIFFAIFSGYVASRRAAGSPQVTRLAPAFWAQTIVMYALLGLRPVLAFLASTPAGQVVDATGHVWLIRDIQETAALAAVFTILAFSAIAALRLPDPRTDARS